MVLASIKDVADLVGSLAWPVVALILVMALRPAIARALESGQLRSVGIGPVTLEFANATATAYQPSAGAVPLIDARTGPAVASFLPDIVAGLEGPDVDYVVVDLGTGGSWLSSRLYVFGELVRRMRGARAFVFLATVNPERVFVGSARIEATLALLARAYPHLDEAFAGAYNAWVSERAGPPGAGHASPTSLSSTGRLPADAVSRIAWDFVGRLQAPVAPPGSPDWVALREREGRPPRAYEHAVWLTRSEIEGLLTGELSRSRVDLTAVSGDTAIARAVIEQHGDFVALVDRDDRFDRLIDRGRLLDAAARACVSD